MFRTIGTFVKVQQLLTSTSSTRLKATSTHFPRGSHLPLAPAPDPENRSQVFLKTVYNAEHNRTDGTPGYGASALAASLFCELVPTAAHFSQAIAHVVNYYLDAEKTNTEGGSSQTCCIEEQNWRC